MRTTRAAAAVARLNRRLPDHHYSLASAPGGLLQLLRLQDGGEEAVGTALMQDEFVAYVDSLGPQAVRRVTRNDAAFERQLVKKPG